MSKLCSLITVTFNPITQRPKLHLNHKWFQGGGTGEDGGSNSSFSRSEAYTAAVGVGNSSFPRPEAYTGEGGGGCASPKYDRRLLYPPLDPLYPSIYPPCIHVSPWITCILYASWPPVSLYPYIPVSLEKTVSLYPSRILYPCIP